MSVVADVDRDGRPDLVLRNADPGASDHSFAAVEIFKNVHSSKNSVWISLKGVKSNPVGAGAKLYATIKGKTHMREVIVNNSAMQGEVGAHFGLGSQKRIDKLQIHWPSGLKSTYEKVEAGRHIFEETFKSMASK